MPNFSQWQDKTSLPKGNTLTFEETNESQYSSLDYLILKQLGKVMEYANNLHNPLFVVAFINSVQALHQIAQFYWMYDEEYKNGIKLLIQWKQDQLSDWEPGGKIEIDKPVLFAETVCLKEAPGAEAVYQLQFETEGQREVSVEELNLITAQLHLNLLMTVITKRQKSRDIEDSY
jgi:hypothetical protein